MDFNKIVPLITEEFSEHGVRYAFIGAFAMGALGMVRATVDLDFLVDSRDADKVTEIMKKYGYRCIFNNENVSQYTSDLKAFGEIDVLYAFRPISLSMLKRSQRVSVFDKQQQIKVVRPEDIVGLKMQAAVNDPSRRNKEMVDIETIMAFYQARLDWRLLADFFEVLGEKKLFAKLKDEYGTTQSPRKK